jgi:hypothetical protein
LADHSARIHAHLHSKKRFEINILCDTLRVISQYYAQAVTAYVG